ncbi:PKD domain-containing protein [Novosphingobium sp. PhB165]|uniref:PKD domain-containing protein n=1 Tax=Novosphingobium sp. PhB165 TaxID=2485105 RepID=UPI001A9D1E2D|nr:PKD domain-containing protein [Novosphingobium sp. PhB165]
MRAGMLAATATLALACVAATPVMAAPAAVETPAKTTLRADGYTADDAMFAHPFVDLDEVRHDGTMAYRYVHGGFEGTDTRFSYYFPVDGWQGRFFQYITPVPDSETLSQGLSGEEDRIGAALTSGAYFIETNGGGPKAADPIGGMDQTIGAYRANAAAARFSRFVAAQVYAPRPHVYGYAYGGSGGAYRTLGSLENTHGVWDGAVPYVLGSPMAIPNMFTVRLNAMRVLGPKLDGVVAALDAGGSGNPYAGLDAQQKAALVEATRMGFPPQSWYAWRTMGPHAFALLFGAVRMVDPSYFSDFWSQPGYEGHDSPELYAADRTHTATRIVEVITEAKAATMGLDTGRSPGTAKGTADLAWKAMGLNSADEVPVALRLEQVPQGKPLLLADLVLPSGKKLLLSDVKDGIAMIGINDPRVVAEVKAGDAVTLDNSDILAVESYHRHQVPPNDGQYPVWDQFRTADGTPRYAQRKMLLGPMFTKNASGAVPNGKFDGKVILIENMWDREALAWQGDWYRRQVAANVGASLDDRFRIWYTDRALHGDQTRQDDPSRVISYIGVLQQALRDLSAWVETGKAPPQSTQYKVVDGQIQVPATASARQGIQPVVTITANGKAQTDVRRGEPVRLAGTVSVPPGAGSVVSAQWDFEGDGTFDEDAKPGTGANVTVSTTHSFDKPGTYFVVLRAASQREGDANTPFARIQNLSRAKIVVRP